MFYKKYLVLFSHPTINPSTNRGAQSSVNRQCMISESAVSVYIYN